MKDDLGNKMANIRKRVREDPEEMAMEVLREWLVGNGVEVSWKSLIATLRDCELSLMADQIQMALAVELALVEYICRVSLSYMSLQILCESRLKCDDDDE